MFEIIQNLAPTPPTGLFSHVCPFNQKQIHLHHECAISSHAVRRIAFLISVELITSV